MKKSYNGWTNYATWRVNLEMFDSDVWVEEFDESVSIYDASKLLQDYAEEYIFQTSTEGLARDYALAFLWDVNWREIAESIYSTYNAKAEA